MFSVPKKQDSAPLTWNLSFALGLCFKVPKAKELLVHDKNKACASRQNCCLNCVNRKTSPLWVSYLCTLSWCSANMFVQCWGRARDHLNWLSGWSSDLKHSLQENQREDGYRQPELNKLHVVCTKKRDGGKYRQKGFIWLVSLKIKLRMWGKDNECILVFKLKTHSSR